VYLIFVFVSGNYYPINTKIAIEDSNNRLAILPDRAQGGSSIFDGTLELMVHRRIPHDDEWGVDEALNETAYGQGLIARGKHWLIYGKKNQNPSLESQERILQNRVLLSNWLFFDDISARGDELLGENYIKSYSLIGEALPEHVYLMTYEPWKEHSFLIRFEHILEKNEDPQLSQPVKFNLTRVFPGDFEFTEVTLSANQWFENQDARLKFNSEGVRSVAQNEPKRIRTQRYLEDLEITLGPMEMRTFVMGPPIHSSVESQIINKFLFLIALVAIFSSYFHF